MAASAVSKRSWTSATRATFSGRGSSICASFRLLLIVSLVGTYVSENRHRGARRCEPRDDVSSEMTIEGVHLLRRAHGGPFRRFPVPEVFGELDGWLSVVAAPGDIRVVEG